MSEEKKIPQEAKTEDEKELSLDDCEKVTGGSIHNVVYTETTEISEDTKRKI